MIKDKNKVARKINTKPAIIFCFFACLLIQIVYTIQVAANGGQLSKLEKEYEQLLADNDKISAEIVKDASLNDLYTFAVEQGFIKPSSIVYITGTDFVAQAR